MSVVAVDGRDLLGDEVMIDGIADGRPAHADRLDL